MLDPTQLPVPPPTLPAPAPGLTPSAISTGTAPGPPKPNLQNAFVRRAMLYNEVTNAQAQRLATATTEPPANTQEMSSKPDELAKAWNYTTSADPAAEFWQLHDQALQANLAQIPPGSGPEVFQAAHNDAETQALAKVYPYRAELIGVGIRQVDDQVAQADRIKKLVENKPEEAAPPPIVVPAPVSAPPPPVIAPPAPMPMSTTLTAMPPMPSGPPVSPPAGGPF